MNSPVNLQKNQAILWARDILARPHDCLVVTGNTGKAGSFAETSNILFAALDGTKFTISISDLEQQIGAVRERLQAKELVVACLPEQLVVAARQAGATQVTILMDHYRRFLGMDVNMAPNCTAESIASWAIDVLRTMASASLTLDQADTGAGKWTSAQFKVTPSMLDKLRSLIK